MYHNDIPMIHQCSIAITLRSPMAIHQAPRQELRLLLRPDLMSGVRDTT